MLRLKKECGIYIECVWESNSYLFNHMHGLVYDFFNFNSLALQGGCITKLEQFLADHLLVIGAVGIGVACLQVSKI